MATKPVRRLASQLRKAPELRLRMGVVDTVNGDGTVDITLGGDDTVIPDVQLLVSATVTAGDTVWVLKQGPVLVAFHLP